MAIELRPSQPPAAHTYSVQEDLWEPGPRDSWGMSRAAQEAERTLHELGRAEYVGGLEGVLHFDIIDTLGRSPIEVRREWLGQAYVTRLAGSQAEVSLPRLHENGISLTEPTFAMPPDSWEEWSFPREPADPKWGRVMGDQASIQSARLLVHADAYSPENQSLRIHADLHRWWTTAKSWIEILSNEDLSGAPKFPTGPGSLTLWSTDKHGKITHHVRPSSMRLEPRASLDLGFQHFLPIAFHAAGLGHAPPMEWETIRHAQAAFEGGHYRRSVAESGLAAELALVRWLGLRHKVLDLRRQSPTLGGLLKKERSFALKAGRESICDDLDYLVEARNAVTHRGWVPGIEEAAAAFYIVRKLIATVLPINEIVSAHGLVLST